jgi:hypothetical protein
MAKLLLKGFAFRRNTVLRMERKARRVPGLAAMLRLDGRRRKLPKQQFWR